MKRRKKKQRFVSVNLVHTSTNGATQISIEKQVENAERERVRDEKGDSLLGVVLREQTEVEEEEEEKKKER